MKYRHLIIASAVSLAAGAAYAEQDTQSQSDPGMSHSQGGSAISKDIIKQVQQKLNQQGFDAGKVDGNWGMQTQQALKNFQQKQGLQASGKLDQQTMSALGVQMSGGAGGQGGGSQAGQGGSQGAGGGASAEGSTSGAGGSQSTGGAGSSQ